MAKWILILVLGVPLAVCLNLNALYDIPKISLIFSCTFLSLLFFTKNLAKKGFVSINLNLLSFFILLYLLVNIISTIFSFSFFLSIFGIYRRYDGMNTLLCYILLFFLSSQIEKPKPILYAIIISASISSIYGILQHFGIFIIPSTTGKERVIAFFGNPNFLACYLLMSIPIVLSFYFKEKRKGVFLFLLVLILISLFFTKTRATFIGLFFELIFFFLFLKPKNKKLFLAIAIAIIIPLILLSLPIIKRIATKDEARIGLYKGSVNVFLAHPLFGTGPECLHLAFIKNIPDEFKEAYKGAYILADKSHNEFLDILATRGIIAFILWIMILCLVFKTAIYSKDRQYTIPIASSILGYLTQAQFNLSLFSITHLLWIMMGLIGGVGKKTKVIIKQGRLIFLLTLIASFPIFYHIACFFFSDMSYHKACVLERSGYKDKAIVYYKRASSLNKWEMEYARKEIECLIALGKRNEAEEKAKKALVFAEDEPKFWFLLARIKEEKEPKEAIAYYKKAIGLSPYWVDLYNNLAILYVSNKDYRNAERYFLLASSLNPDYKENLKNLYKEEIKVNLSENRLKEAKANALKLLLEDPNDKYAQEVLRYIEKR